MECQTRTMLRCKAYGRSCITIPTCYFCNLYCDPSFNSQTTRIISLKSTPFPQKSFRTVREKWKVGLALDTGGGISGNGEQESFDNNNSGPNLGRTRLGRIVSAGGKQLLEKLREARKNFPMKVFLILLGFYTANALATILGQTGDWDVLVAGVVVAAIEGIGMLMYKKQQPPPPEVAAARTSGGRLQSFVMMVNYWKAGVCLGLFVDAFKLGS